MAKRLLVIGCGRSGTRYASKVFRAVGIDVGHENPGEDGKVDWRAIGRPEDLQYHETIIHQMREPLGVIASFHTVMNSSWRYICSTDLPGDGDEEFRPTMDMPLLERCMAYWFWWNVRCQKAAEMSYQVEQLPSRIGEITSLTGRKISENVLGEASKVSTSDHTRKKGHKTSGSYPDITWDDLTAENEELASMVWHLAARHGYVRSDFS